ncbi:MAG TPA: TrbC/VirB2 family protein [Thermoanaerobaculia bacterium]|nr:TrbC/VirB2 family protein [Thermoanaerobaculia bacterium]
MNKLHRPSLFLVLLAALPAQAFASTGGPSLPWDSAVQTLVDNLSGPLAHAAVIGALVIAGALWAFSEHQTGVKRLSQVVFGGAVAVGAVDLAGTLGILGSIV